MLTAVYFGFGLMVVVFLMCLVKLWRTHRRMVARDAVISTRMMEATRDHQQSTDSVSTGKPAQGSLWED